MRIAGRYSEDITNMHYSKKNNPTIIRTLSTYTRNKDAENVLHARYFLAIHTIHSPNSNSSLYI